MGVFVLLTFLIAQLIAMLRNKSQIESRILAVANVLVGTFSVVQRVMSEQRLHHYVKTYIGMVRKELASAVRCPH